MAVTFIGDVHGWSDRLDRLLAKTDGDLVFVGDLIDRGPDAPGVVDRVRALCASGRAACIMGNHEYALVRGLGVPALRIPADPELYHAWVERYGGAAVLRAYRAEGPEQLRARLGPALEWMARLPWVLEGKVGARRWLAVHAGLASRPGVAEQVAALRDPLALMRETDGELPPVLYAKARAFIVPDGCPSDLCIVSGHTPLPRARVGPQRILCDTSGGMPDRLLSAVVFPEGTVLTS